MTRDCVNIRNTKSDGSAGIQVGHRPHSNGLSYVVNGTRASGNWMFGPWIETRISERAEHAAILLLADGMHSSERMRANGQADARFLFARPLGNHGR